MDESSLVGFIISVLVVMSFILLLHHRYSHRKGGEHPLEGWDQWFQMSDVGNCHSCSHEMWILSIMLVALLLSVYNLLFHALKI